MKTFVLWLVIAVPGQSVNMTASPVVYTDIRTCNAAGHDLVESTTREMNGRHVGKFAIMAICRPTSP